MEQGHFNIQTAMMVLLSLIVTATLHEFAHAFAADRLGDETPRKLGRVSLIPLDQFDFMRGFALIVFSFCYFGLAWGKPVPVNRESFKNPRRDDLIVAASGPVMNLALVLILAVIMRTGYFHLAMTSPWHRLIDAAFEVNVVTLLFNIVPVPPFDGARILGDLLSEENEKQYQRFLGQWGLVAIATLVIFGSPFIMLAANKSEAFFGSRYERLKTAPASPKPAQPPGRTAAAFLSEAVDKHFAETYPAFQATFPKGKD